MTTDTPAPESGPITIDQAVSILDAAEKRDEAQPEAAPEGPDTDAEPTATDASEPETVADGDTAEPEDGETEGEPEQSAIEPPRFWDAGAKERFRELPTDLQELVLAKETERDKATSKAIEEAALKRKAADGEASRIAQLNGVLDKLLPQVDETFRSRWENVDWNAVVDQYGADQALKLKNQYEAEKTQVQQLVAARAEASQVQFQRYVQTEMAKLPSEAPELADPKLGEQRRGELAKFLVQEMTKRGMDTANINRLSAWESSIAYDAMRWRQAQAKAKDQSSAPRTQPNRTVTPPKPSVRPTATPGRAGSPQQARLQQLSRKPSLTMDEAVELLDLKAF
jgi:hypothetical protein